MKGIAKLGISLAIFAAAACASLAVVYAITEPAIANQNQIALTASIKQIFPDVDSFEAGESVPASDDPDVSLESLIFVKGVSGPLGVAVKASGPSYGGKATLLVGVSPDGTIAGVRVLVLNDTPGLGANAKNAGYYVNKENKTTFPGQFKGKSVQDPFEVKNDVVAITASTITSRSLTKIVKAASKAAAEWLASSAADQNAAAGEPSGAASAGEESAEAPVEGGN